MSLRPLLLLFLLPLLGCPAPRAVGLLTMPEAEVIEYEPYLPEEVAVVDGYDFRRRRKRALEPANYLPDTTNERYLQHRYLRVSFHIMNTSDTLFDMHGARARTFFKQLVRQTDKVFKKMPEPWLFNEEGQLGAAAGARVLPRQLSVVLARKPGTDEPAIYEHYDDKLAGYQHVGRQRNRGDRTVIKKYGVGTNSVLNVFVMGPRRDSLLSKSFELPGNNGVYLGDAIKITGVLSTGRSAWEHARNLAHEIGHALTLAHAWRNDGCDDTPLHDNDCWYRSQRPGCDSLTSNNLMDYSYRQEALTPCQIGRIHAALNDINRKQRRWLVPRWCEFTPTENIRVTKDLDWAGDRDFNSDVVVKRGATLRMNGRVHLPETGRILVDPGGTLVLGPDLVVHNACGGTWAGLQVGRSQTGERGRVIVEAGTPTFANLAP